MKLTVILFAAAKELAGTPSVQVDVDDRATVADLRSRLTTSVPALKPISASLLFAVNSQYASDAVCVSADDEIACFPPVSGG